MIEEVVPEQNTYGNLLPAWKVELIAERARLRRFRRFEINDVLQEVVPAVLAFKYDPEKSNGATEATALTTLIDRQLVNVRRQDIRYHRRKVRAQSLTRLDSTANAPEEAVGLAVDIADVVQALPMREQWVCGMLLDGACRSEIAKLLNMTWFEMEKSTATIRIAFLATGVSLLQGGA